MIERLKNDLKEAMKSKDTIQKSTLQLTIGKAQSFAKAEAVKNKTEISVCDNHIMEAIKSELKQTVDALSQMKEHLTEEQIREYDYRITILKNYLPAQLSQAEVVAEILEAICTLEVDKDMKNMKYLMSCLKNKLGDTVDGKVLSTALKEILSAK